MKKLLKLLLMSLFALAASMAVAEERIPLGDYHSFRTGISHSCGRVEVSSLGDEYPGLEIRVYGSAHLPERDYLNFEKMTQVTAQIEFPKLGNLPSRIGWEKRIVDTYRGMGSGICFEESERISARDPSDSGLSQSSTVCYDAKRELLEVSLPGSRELCRYQLAR